MSKTILKFTIIFVFVFICALLFVKSLRAKEPIALVDPTQLSSWHADLMKNYLEQQSASYTHYQNGIVIDLSTIAQFNEASVVVIPRSLTVDGCDNQAEMGAVSNALRDLSQTAIIYVSSFECPEFDKWVTRMSVVKDGVRPGYLPELPRGSDLEIEACLSNWCTDSFAIVQAGVNNASS